MSRLKYAFQIYPSPLMGEGKSGIAICVFRQPARFPLAISEKYDIIMSEHFKLYQLILGGSSMKRRVLCVVLCAVLLCAALPGLSVLAEGEGES